MPNVAIVGATGYTGAEMIRLLQNHPKFNITHIVSSSQDTKICELYPNLIGYCDKYLEPLDVATLAKDTDIAVMALPHGKSQQFVPQLFKNSDMKIIDLGADYRYNNPETYRTWYNLEHQSIDLLAQAVYGLPELHKEEIKSSRLVGNPGCYTTCSILGVSPLLSRGVIDPHSIIIDAKSGVTGAGKSPSSNTHFCETNESTKAYSIGTHRHTSEIEQELSLVSGNDIIVNFTPHLIPVNRGILATIYANLNQQISKSEIYNIYKDFYIDSPFVKVLENGLPELKYVVGSNNCYIGFEIDKRTNRIVVVSAIDNLIKGACGQAIQNMNLMFGFEETLGLNLPAWYL